MDIMSIEIPAEFLTLAALETDTIFGFENETDREPFIRYTALRMWNEATAR